MNVAGPPVSTEKTQARTWPPFDSRYEPVDAWGQPLRYVSADTLKWAKVDISPAKSVWDGDGNDGNTEWPIQELLATKLQDANWSFFIESGGPDKQLGWSEPPPDLSNPGGTLDPQQVKDNVYSIAAE